MRNIIVSILVVLFFNSSFIYSQKKVRLPNSTLVVVKTVQDYIGKELKTGQEITCVIAMDIVIEEDTLIKTGAPVFCLVQDAEGSGMVGAGGEIIIAFQNTIAVDGTNIPLTGTFRAEGESSTGEKVAIGVILCPLALLCKGEEAELPSGTQGRGFTMGEFQITIKEMGS